MTTDLAIEWWPTDRPVDYPKNARKWSQKAVEKVAASIREYGWRQPLVVDTEGVLVIGHLRRSAARHLKLTEVPVHIARDLSPEKIRGLRLADNRSHDEATWDEDLLRAEFGELKALNFDLSMTAFDSRQVDSFLGPKAGETDADDVPEVPEAPVSVAGDLWLLCEHRVLCGDSTDGAAVEKVTGDRNPALMVTDPPYGVDYHPEWRVEAGVNKPWQKRAEGKVDNDGRADWSPAWKLFRGSIAYVWHAGVHAAVVAQSLELAEFQIRSQIIWAKSTLVMGRGHYHWQHEPCWYAVRETAEWKGDRKQSTLWSIPSMHRTQGNVDDGRTIHSTQKPVECMRRPMVNHTEAGSFVYDPFLGSGTTLIAAETIGRICCGIELNPAYVDVIVERWQKFTGRAAIHAETGATFEQMRAGRLVAA